MMVYFLSLQQKKMTKIFITAILAAVSIFILYKFYIGKFPTEFQENALFVDVRTPEEFAGGSAPHAINIPLGTIESRLDQFKDQEQVVVFCRSGGRSGQAKTILEKHGIQNVINGGPWQNVANNVSK